LGAEDSRGGESVSTRKVIIGRVLNNATGGTIVSDDSKARIQVPPVALKSQWDIFGLVQATTTAPAYMPKPPPGLVQVSPMYELIPAAYQFQRPVTFQIAIAPPTLTPTLALPHQGGGNSIGMYVYNPDTGVWDRLPSQMSVMTDTTTGITADLFTYPTLTTVPNFDGFYA